MPKLIVTEGKSLGFEIELTDKTVVAGRRADCDIVVDNPRSSRQNTEIFKYNKRYYVRDLESVNGTYLNSKRIEGDEMLDIGDEVSMAGATICFTEDEDARKVPEIHGYEILRQIGSGGMGVVCKARQVSMDRVVAMKILNERYCSDIDFINRFIKEARAAGKLDHPHIIRVYDVTKQGRIYFFAMEFVDGPTLRSLLKHQGMMNETKSIEIIKQTAEALAYAHKNSIIHQDVKPANIILTSDGKVKLADLGIAKTYDEAAETDKKKIFGTPHYMSPEQARGDSTDLRTDIYSLGATLYHILTGKAPFHRTTITKVIKAHLSSEIPPVHEINPRASDSLCSLVDRMTATDPAQRHRSMEAVIKELEDIQKGSIIARRAAPAVEEDEDEYEAENEVTPREISSEDISALFDAVESSDRARRSAESRRARAPKRPRTHPDDEIPLEEFLTFEKVVKLALAFFLILVIYIVARMVSKRIIEPDKENTSGKTEGSKRR